MNKLESEGYNAIMAEVRVSDDPGDPWGSNMEWLFALGDVAWLLYGTLMPEYRPSPFLEGQGVSGYAAETLADLAEDEIIAEDDMRRVYTVLSRRYDILKALGKDY